MVAKSDFRRINENVWEISRDYRPDMRVPARLYADEELLDATLGDKSVEQLLNTATLPGVVQYAIAMPDIHQGYGFPLGGVVATRLPDGAISPGGVGYDINCGIRLLASALTVDEVRPALEELASMICQICPSGVGSHGELKLKDSELDEVLVNGAKWALNHDLAKPEDLERTEQGGIIPSANPEMVSQRARDRGRNQLGTLGAGNHFIELDRVAEVYEPEIADRLGLAVDRVAVQVHCGSRGFGHQVCEDYVSRFQEAMRHYGIELPDRELACAPFDSPEGEEYFQAMVCAANFAFANRQVLAHNLRHAFEQVLAGRVHNFELRQVYDIAHNMAKVEEHDIGGQRLRVCVHRKGATRAFGPGSAGLPADLQEIGQPVLIPGSMGTESYVLVGTRGSMRETFGSTCHGAGRVLSRARARRLVRGWQLRTQLEAGGIIVRAGSMADFAEEAPLAYKDVSRVVAVVHAAGIGRKVARLQPIAVVKG